MAASLQLATRAAAPILPPQEQQYVCVFVSGQTFGIPVLQVQDVLLPQRIGCIPLAPPEIAGLLNLRGRIVTAIDLSRRLGVVGSVPLAERLSVVIDRDGELYSLLVDDVGEVLSLSADTFEADPATLDPKWREISAGIHRLDSELLIILDVEHLLEFTTGVEKV